MNRLFCAGTVVISALLPGLVWAGAPPGDISSLPEPGTFELLVLGGVVAAVVAIRNWRRK
jgi:hypothetical protein